MPVKVRCPTCEKVLNAPESARGKAVKCPGCETRVKVPAGESGPSKKATRNAEEAGDDDSFLADLDLNKAIDSSHSMCPKCGASMPDDATECPKCGVDPTTGMLSARAKKRKGMKGPDPALFYKAAWKDSWEFTKSNYTVALRTAVYLILANLVSAGCSFMVGYCETKPPKVFWLSMNLITNLAWLGWPWHLVVETVQTTVGRKSNIRGIHFDAFQCIALGIKWILWCIAFCWFPFAFLMYPLAMIHMAMPVTKRAWINFAMFSTFFKNLGPTLYYWDFVVLSWLAVGLTTAIMIVPLALAMGAKLAEFQAARFAQKPPSGTMDWVIIGILVVIGIIAAVVYGFTEVFKARVIGLMAYYFKDSLDLVVLIAEKEYKRKEVKVDKWGNPIKSTQQKVTEAVVALVVIAIVAAVGYWLYVTQFKKN